MASSLGSLVVSLGLDAAQFTSGLTKSEYQAKQFAATLNSAVTAGVIKAQLALEALAKGAKFAAETFQTLTTGAGKFSDLSDATGAAAEDIASLAVAAATAGVSIDDVAGAANKLTKNLVGVTDESQASGAALKAIGINIKEFKALDPVAQYEAVAKALGNFADGSGKVAIAQALFGKSGGEQLRVLKELNDEGGRTAILTAAQIKAADDYSDAQTKARKTLELYLQAAATQAIPALTDLTNVAKGVVKELLGIDSASTKLGSNDGVKTFADDAADVLAFVADSAIGVQNTFLTVGKSIGGIGAVLKNVFTGNIQQARAALKEADADIERILMRPTFRQRLDDVRNARTSTDAQRRVEDRGFTPRPALTFEGVDASAGARLNKQLEGQLKAIKDFAAEQKAAFDFANTLVKGSYDDGLSTLKQFFDAQATVRAADLTAQLAAIDKEVAALAQHRKQTLKPEERIDDTNKIAEAERRRSELIASSSRSNVLATLEENRAAQQLARTYVDLLAQVTELSGDKRGAASLRIAGQLAAAQKLVAQTGADPGIVDQLQRQLTGQADLSDAQDKYNRLLQQSSDAQDRIALAAQESGKSELDTLRDVGLARSQSLQQLSKLVDEANELALALGTPDAIAFAEKLGLAFKKAAAEVDPLLGKIKDLGKEAGDSIANSFEDAITQGKSLRALLQSISADLSKIIVHNVFTKPFGDYLSGAIGGNGQSSGGGGLIGSFLGAIGSYFTGGGTGATTNFSTASGLSGGRAIGGPVSAYSLHPVAERGPEVFDDGSRQYLLSGKRSGNVYPLTAGGRTLHVSNTFVIQGATTTRTQQQVAAMAARSVATANARLN